MPRPALEDQREGLRAPSDTREEGAERRRVCLAVTLLLSPLLIIAFLCLYLIWMVPLHIQNAMDRVSVDVIEVSVLGIVPSVPIHTRADHAHPLDSGEEALLHLSVTSAITLPAKTGARSALKPLCVCVCVCCMYIYDVSGPAAGHRKTRSRSLHCHCYCHCHCLAGGRSLNIYMYSP